MCEPTTIALAITAVGAAVTAYGTYQEASVQKQVANNNAKTAEYAAQDATKRGEEQAQKVRRQADQLKGAQRAMFAVKGVDVNEGTAGIIQDQTDFFGNIDANTARDNASFEAWQYRQQGGNFRGQAAGINPGLSATSSLLTSAGSVASKWQTSGSSSSGRRG